MRDPAEGLTSISPAHAKLGGDLGGSRGVKGITVDLLLLLLPVCFLVVALLLLLLQLGKALEAIHRKNNFFIVVFHLLLLLLLLLLRLLQLRCTLLVLSNHLDGDRSRNLKL